MEIQRFNITFNKGGWGLKPVADGIELSESFRTKEKAVLWLEKRSIRTERQFSKAQDAWDNMADE